ncbi:DNA annealing helicase and endonuclease ZRANB3-like isoform X2 [Corticium candelabrum]|nr:DNA annealing helicase and endonuclease ZRANB3-like isoform X2 [Corticium candelabrum]
MLTENVMIRRLKLEVMEELPPKIRQKIPFDIPETGMKEMQKSFDHMKKLFGVLKGSVKSETVGDRDTWCDAKSLLTNMFLKTGEAKIFGILAYLIDFLEIAKQDTKCLVFAHHLVVQRAIAEVFVKERIGFVHIYGEVPAHKRQEYVKRFQEDAETRVALLSLKAANTGLTLTAATHVVFTELYWNPGDLLQAEDRCHRIGQHQSVHIHYLIGKGSLDELLWLMLCRKVVVTSTTLNGKTDILRAEELDTNLQQFVLTCTTSLSNQMHSTCNDSTDICSHAAEASKDLQKQNRVFVDLFASSPECHFEHTSESEDESKLLEMELQSLRHRRESTCKRNRTTKVQDGLSNYKHIQSDKWDDSSREFCKENRRFRNGKRSECIARESDPSESSTVQCADCDEAVDVVASWSCSCCTFSNVAGAVVCEMCDSVRTSHGKKISEGRRDVATVNTLKTQTISQRCDDSELKILDNSKWMCEKCTHVNFADCCLCEMCHAAKSIENCGEKIVAAEHMEMENERHREDQQTDVLNRNTPCQEWECTSGKSCSTKQPVVMVSPPLANEQQQQQKLVDNELLLEDTSAELGHMQCEDGQMNIHCEIDSDNKIEVRQCSSLTGVKAQVNSRNCDDSYNGKQHNSRQSDSHNRTGESFNDEIDFLPATPTKPSDGATEITVIPETPPKQQPNRPGASGNSDYFSDIGGSTEMIVDNEGQLNISSCTDVSIISETGWDDDLLEGVIGSEPDEWETETISNILPAGEQKTVGKHQHTSGYSGKSSTPSKRQSSAVGMSRNFVPASTLIRHPDPPQQYVPPVAPDPPKDGQFKFYVCHNTERFALYTKDGLYLQCTVSASDVLYPVDGSLPVLLDLRVNLHAVQEFVSNYVGLSVRDRALLRNRRRVISDVSSALAQIKENTRKKKVYSRFASKEKFNETAIIEATEAAGGKLQIVEQIVQSRYQKNKKRKRKTRSEQLIEDKETTNGEKRMKYPTQQPSHEDKSAAQAEPKTRQYIQGMLSDGQRICASCTIPFQPRVLPNCPELPYGGRFCCRECYMVYLIKTSRQVGRDVVAEQERGVCALCNVDTGELLSKLKVLTNKDDRMKLLKETGHFAELSEKVLSDIVQMPKAGKLWHADHIYPVACGGGACTRENLRALCVPCHQNETKNVKVQARSRGCQDIRSFLSKHD